MPELYDQLCLGAVNGGVKVCTLGGDVCSFATHSKKAEVHQGHLYIAGSHNNAYTQHSLDPSNLMDTQVKALLLKQHMVEEWVQLFHAVNDAFSEVNPDSFPTLNERAMGEPQPAITP